MIRRAATVAILAALVSVLSATAATAATAASAAKRPTVVQAIERASRVISKDPTFNNLANFHPTTVSQAESLVPKFEALHRLLNRQVAKVEKSRVTPGQRVGKKDWVTGVRQLGTAIGDFADALQDVIDGDTSTAEALATKTGTLERAAAKKISRGERLLGL